MKRKNAKQSAKQSAKRRKARSELPKRARVADSRNGVRIRCTRQARTDFPVDNTRTQPYSEGMDPLSEQVATAIRRSKMTLREIHRATGIPPGTVSRFLREQRGITLRVANKLLDGLGYKVKLTRTRPTEAER